MKDPARALLEPGHDVEWAAINREEADQLRTSHRCRRAMSQNELSGPDLTGIVADADAVGLPYLVIGGFSVI